MGLVDLGILAAVSLFSCLKLLFTIIITFTVLGFLGSYFKYWVRNNVLSNFHDLFQAKIDKNPRKRILLESTNEENEFDEYPSLSDLENWEFDGDLIRNKDEPPDLSEYFKDSETDESDENLEECE